MTRFFYQCGTVAQAAVVFGIVLVAGSAFML